MSIFGGEGETRTPAPVTRPTPLAGAPRHQLEYFSVCDVISHDIQLNAGKMQVDYRGLSACNMAEKVGFEPTVPCEITGFQDRLLKPLGHLSEFAYESLIIITHKAEVVNPFLCRKTGNMFRTRYRICRISASNQIE